MGNKAVDDLGDLFGDPAPSTKKGVKTVGTTKDASAAAAAASAAKHAKPKVTVTTKGKMAAVGAGAARIMKKSEGAAPAKAKAPAPLPKKGAAAKAAKPAAKKAAAGNGERAGKGAGKYYFAPEDRAAVVKLLGQKVKKPTTTKEFAAANDLPTWQVRLAATDLVADKKMTLKKDGAALTMSPK